LETFCNYAAFTLKSPLGQMLPLPSISFYLCLSLSLSLSLYFNLSHFPFLIASVDYFSLIYFTFSALNFGLLLYLVFCLLYLTIFFSSCFTSVTPLLFLLGLCFSFSLSQNNSSSNFALTFSFLNFFFFSYFGDK
jgi:hypothetical protein